MRPDHHDLIGLLLSWNFPDQVEPIHVAVTGLCLEIEAVFAVFDPTRTCVMLGPPCRESRIPLWTSRGSGTTLV